MNKKDIDLDGDTAWDAVSTIRALKATETPFCRVCVRAGPEEKLVPARSTVDLASMLHLNNLWKYGAWQLGAPGLACVWCEATASAALRVVRSLRAADAAHDDRRFVSGRAMAELNQSARRERPRRLRTADVLRVSNAQVPAAPPAPAPPLRLPPEPSLPAWRQDMQMIVIDDDDDIDPPDRAGLVADAATLTPTPTPKPQLAPQPFILAPRSPTGPVCITPTMSQVAVPQRAPMNMTNVLMSDGSVQRLYVVQEQVVNIVRGSAGPPVAAHREVVGVGVGRLLRVQKPKGKKKVKKKEDDSETPLCVVANVVGGCESPPPRAGGGGGGGGDKQPVRNADKVDWEDKIPMDVISFMDATDPRADIFMVPDHCPSTN